MRRCPDIAQSEIEALRDDGIEVTLDDIVWLASLAYKVEFPGGKSVNPLIHNAPVTVGNLELYPLTIQGSMFMDLVATEKWCRERDYIEMLAWILSAGQEPGAFDGINTRGKFRRALAEFKRDCTASLDNLASAVALIIDDDAPEEPGKERATVNYREFLGSLEAASGQPVTDWLTRTGDEAREVIRQAYGIHHGFDNDNDQRQQIREATRDMIRAVNEIRERHRGGHNTSEDSNGEA